MGVVRHKMEKVLIVDDSEILREIVKDILIKADYEVVSAANGLEAISILQNDDSPNLVLLDRVMPFMYGDEVCRWVRRNINTYNYCYRYKYMILLTIKNDQDEVLEGFELGADDYITKPFDSRELLARLSVGKRILKLQQDLWDASMRDSLTNLYNRRAINEFLALKLQQASRKEKHVAIVMVDIDDFKYINDTFGHIVGDEVLVSVADSIQTVLRDADLAGRLGGDEFIFSFDCESEQEALQVCERVQLAVKANPLHFGGDNKQLMISIGVVLVNGDVDFSQGIRWADQAMYESKKSGRNKITIFSRNLL